ncbi:hypothetical protein Msil_3341 [Methylocella silvestris BL2]|uniref:Uncharacterized protein n=1 Tax=Methylocella silvestris (strain DSM 15510 / CIP 108128 / LMG 27833 / NCIMB 13906 / BL2) TaxID=395965 RepID=B8ES32_METSB|nr:hypothetical protein [Methylocella silvestris]ACK52247.1 hypothetical protein Msil_3341 [Methylocella silvestris BL2]
MKAFRLAMAAFAVVSSASMIVAKDAGAQSLQKKYSVHHPVEIGRSVGWQNEALRQVPSTDSYAGVIMRDPAAPANFSD